jgi:hypothetical protein
MSSVLQSPPRCRRPRFQSQRSSPEVIHIHHFHFRCFGLCNRKLHTCCVRAMAKSVTLLLLALCAQPRTHSRRLHLSNAWLMTARSVDAESR